MPDSQTNSAIVALVEARRSASAALHTQLEEGLRAAVRDGLLPLGARLPASRQLAEDLGVSRSVVVEAYEQLVAEGYLTARTGSATRVAGTETSTPHRPRPSDTGAPRAPTFDLRPGSPDLATFPRAAWIKALQAVTRDIAHDDLGYGDGLGHPAARAVLTGWLTRTRAAAARPEHAILTNGFGQALDITCRALAATGHRELAVEDPGHPEQREMIGRLGLTPVPVPVDAGGLVVDALAVTRARAVLVTPAHQFPTGVVLAPHRRQALVAWARERSGLVVEDDYDAEYRYDRAPVGCVQGLAPDVVVYGGSASKMLAPALRLGWLLAPPALEAELVREKCATDYGSPVIGQLALAHLIDTGTLSRHLRHTRARYRARRDQLVDALATRLPGASVLGIAAGMNAVVMLPPGTDERAVEHRGAARGVAVRGMHRYRLTSTGPPALVLGYTRLPARSLGPAINELARAVVEAR